MRGEEVDYLTKNKLSEGKDYPQINKEIKDLRQSQIILKNNHREILRLNKEITKLTNLNEKLKAKVFDLGLRASQNKTQKVKSDTISYLRRIMIILKKDKLKPSEIAKKIKADNSEVKECMRFLEKYKLVKSKKLNGQPVYFRE